MFNNHSTISDEELHQKITALKRELAELETLKLQREYTRLPKINYIPSKDPPSFLPWDKLKIQPKL